MPWLAGLVVPAAAQAVLGTAGGALVIVIIFMVSMLHKSPLSLLLASTTACTLRLVMRPQATTSAVTAELVGVSSLLTYDIWKIYIRPKVSSWVFHVCRSHMQHTR